MQMQVVLKEDFEPSGKKYSIDEVRELSMAVEDLGKY
jgi:hypothetical protein